MEGMEERRERDLISIRASSSQHRSGKCSLLQPVNQPPTDGELHDCVFECVAVCHACNIIIHQRRVTEGPQGQQRE